MPTSPDGILATHVGSLVRPPKLVEFLKLIEYESTDMTGMLPESGAGER